MTKLNFKSYINITVHSRAESRYKIGNILHVVREKLKAAGSTFRIQLFVSERHKHYHPVSCPSFQNICNLISPLQSIIDVSHQYNTVNRRCRKYFIYTRYHRYTITSFSLAKLLKHRDNMPQAIPVITCGKHETIAKSVAEGLLPEVEGHSPFSPPSLPPSHPIPQVTHTIQ